VIERCAAVMSEPKRGRNTKAIAEGGEPPGSETTKEREMKRYLTGVVAVAALVVLAACGGGSSSSGSGSGKSLTIAFPVPLTSGNSAAAEQMVKAAELAVKTINANGGAGGRQLVLKVYDDKLTADESAKVAQRAITVDKAEVIMGGYTSIEGLAIREVTERRKVVYIATSTVSPQLTADATYTFRAANVDKLSYPVQMAELYAKLGFKKPVVSHDDGPTGATLFGPINDELTKQGLHPSTPVGFQLKATDLSSAVGAIKGEKPDSLIHIGSSGADAGLLMKTLAEQGVHVPVLGFGSLISSEARNIGGPAYGSGDVYTLANMQPSKKQFQDLADLYAKAYGGTESEVASKMVEQVPQTWDAFQALRQALDSTKGKTDGDSLAKALHDITPFEGAAGKAGSNFSFQGRQDGFNESLVPFKFDGTRPVEFTG